MINEAAENESSNVLREAWELAEVGDISGATYKALKAPVITEEFLLKFVGLENTNWLQPGYFDGTMENIDGVDLLLKDKKIETPSEEFLQMLIAKKRFKNITTLSGNPEKSGSITKEIIEEIGQALDPNTPCLGDIELSIRLVQNDLVTLLENSIAYFSHLDLTVAQKLFEKYSYTLALSRPQLFSDEPNNVAELALRSHGEFELRDYLENFPDLDRNRLVMEIARRGANADELSKTIGVARDGELSIETAVSILSINDLKPGSSSYNPEVIVENWSKFQKNDQELYEYVEKYGDLSRCDGGKRNKVYRFLVSQNAELSEKLDQLEKLLDTDELRRKWNKNYNMVASLCLSGITEPSINLLKDLSSETKGIYVIAELGIDQLVSLKNTFDIDGLDKLIDFLSAEPKLTNLLCQSRGIDILLDKNVAQQARMHYLDLGETELLLRNRVDVNKLINGGDYSALIAHLADCDSDWKDERTVVAPFRMLAEVFGYKQALRFSLRYGKSRHDCLLSASGIVKLFTKSKLSPEQFCGNILFQVAGDRSVVRGMDSYQRLFELVRMRMPSRDKLVKDLNVLSSDLSNAVSLQYSNDSSKYDSWKLLEIYGNYCYIASKKKFLNEIKSSGIGSAARDYFLELLQLPDVRVNVRSLELMLTKPTKYLSTLDINANNNIHDQVLPIRMTEIDNLNLSAKDLCDGLAGGEINETQIWPIAKAEYWVLPDINMLDVKEITLKALGSRSSKIEGIAKNPGRLYKELISLFGERDHLDKFLTSGHLPKNLNSQQVSQLLFNETYGLDRQGPPFIKVVAEVHKKNSVDGAVAGDRCKNCMPKGSGKAVVYEYSPATAVFTISLEEGDKKRLLATSLMVANLQLNKLQREVIDLERGKVDLSKLGYEEIVASCERELVLGLDSVEIPDNVRNQGENIGLVSQIYVDFFRRYMDLCRQVNGMNLGSRMSFGTYPTIGVNNCFTSMVSVSSPNNLLPLTPLSYSDNDEEATALLGLESEFGIDDQLIKSMEIEDRGDSRSTNIGDLRAMKFRDFWTIAKGESLLGNDPIEAINELQAISYAHRLGRASSYSYIINDGEGKFGYFIAYSGTLRDESYKWSKENFGRDCITVSRLYGIDDEKMAVVAAELISELTRNQQTNLPVVLRDVEISSREMFVHHFVSEARNRGFEVQTDKRQGSLVGEEHILMKIR